MPAKSDGMSGLLVCLSKLAVVAALVEGAQVAADQLLSDEAIDPELGSFLARSKGLFIAPDIRPAALILGGACGGVFMARRPGSEDWNGPTFHLLGGVASGLELPGPSSAVFLLAMTEQGVDAFLSGNVELGNRIRIAAAGTADDADILSFAFPGGARSSLSLENAVITACAGLNQAIHGLDVMPADIIIRGTPPSTSAAGLVRTLTRLAHSRRETQRRRVSFPRRDQRRRRRPSSDAWWFPRSAAQMAPARRPGALLI